MWRKRRSARSRRRRTVTKLVTGEPEGLWAKLKDFFTLEFLRRPFKRKMSESLLSVVDGMSKEGLEEVSIKLRTHKLLKGKRSCG